MDEEIKKQLDHQDELLNKIFISTEKTRKYFLASLIITVVMIFLPLIGLLFAIPQFLKMYSGLSGFGL